MLHRIQVCNWQHVVDITIDTADLARRAGWKTTLRPTTVWQQGQRPLTPLASKDFCHEVEIPAATATFHGDAFRAGMLLEQR